MGKTRLKRLSGCAFRSMKGEFQFTFPDSGIVSVIARNLDTGGSSGGGKSGFLQALNSALGVGPFPLTDQQSWGTKKALQLKLELESERLGPVILSRGKANSLTWPGGEATGAGSIKDKLQEVLGMPLEMLGAFIYSPQQDPEDFLSLPNAKKQEFLSTLLSLGMLESAVSKALTASKDLGTKLTMKQAAQAQAVQTVTNFLAVLKPPVMVDLGPFDATLLAAEKRVQDAEWQVEALRLQLEVKNDEWREQAAKIPKFEIDPVLLTAVEQTTSALQEFKGRPVVEGEKVGMLKKYLQQGQDKLAEVQLRETAKKVAHQAEIHRLDVAVRAAQSSSAEADRLQKEVEVLQRNVEVLASNACHTCGQQWLKAKEEETKLRTKWQELLVRITGLRYAGSLETELVRQFQALQFTPDPLVKDLSDIIARLRREVEDAQRLEAAERQSQLADFQSRVSVAEKAVLEAKNLTQAAVNIINTRILTEKGDFVAKVNSAKQHLGQEVQLLNNEKHVLNNARLSNQSKLDEYKSKREYLDQLHGEQKAQGLEIDQLIIDKNAEDDFVQLVGREGFLGTIFDEVLSEISAETNDILGRIANTAHVSLEFRSETETKKGTVTKEIRPVVTIGGFEAPLRSGCSGGMISAVRLAVRIAIRRVIGRRTGAEICWLALDESFDGLDDVCKEACAEILNEAARTELIFIVDHSAAFKAMIVQTIELEFTQGITTVKESSI